MHFAATIERAEKQIILARYGRRLLNLLDDTPVVPGDVRQPFPHTSEARQILSDAEQDLQAWQANLEPIQTNASGLGSNLMPTEDLSTRATSEAGTEQPDVTSPGASSTHNQTTEPQGQGTRLEQATA